LLLWVLASLPANSLERIQVTPESALLQIVLSDPCMHATTFAVLATLLTWGFERGRRRRVPCATGATLALGYGFLIELYQWALPWRAFGLDDLAWNAVGVIAGLALAWLWFHIRRPAPAPPVPETSDG